MQKHKRTEETTKSFSFVLVLFPVANSSPSSSSCSRVRRARACARQRESEVVEEGGREGGMLGWGGTMEVREGEDSPEPMIATARSTAGRTSFVDSFMGCGISGIRVDKEDLKRKITIPDYLRRAMAQAIRLKEPEGDIGWRVNDEEEKEEEEEEEEEEEAPAAPIVVFVNPRSGGRHGAVLMAWLQQLIGKEQVFDPSVVAPSDFVQYGLACLENLGCLGDRCAKATREKMRIMVAGGDGTVGWVLGSLGELNMHNRMPVPPTGIIPLGTGNDLSRSFGWGGSFPFVWRSAVKRSFSRAITGRICHLDSWQVLLAMRAGKTIEAPHSLKHIEACTISQEDYNCELAEDISCFGGVFYNYFSIGMDAQVAYGFHHLREKSFLAQGPIANKLIYSGYGCTQGWFFTPCLGDPGLRGLKNILRLYIKKVDCEKWEKIDVPPSVRALVALNLQNYGSGRHPWGFLKPEYLEKRGFVEAHSDDGLLEIFGLKQGWHASLVMTELISAKHIAQAASVRFEIRGGEWKDAFMQMDGEPWKQPIQDEYSTFVEIKRVPHHSVMITGD